MSECNKIIIRLHKNFYNFLELKKQINNNAKNIKTNTNNIDSINSKLNKLLLGMPILGGLFCYAEYKNIKFRIEVRKGNVGKN